MNNRGKIIALIVVLFIVVVGATIALNMKKTNTGSNATMSQSTMTPPKSTSSSDKAVATNSVTIQNFAFSPTVITVKAGTKVTWTNKDSIGHTVTADVASAEAPNSNPISQDGSYSFTFTKAGTYTYHCTPHPYMKGTVIVTE